MTSIKGKATSKCGVSFLAHMRPHTNHTKIIYYTQQGQIILDFNPLMQPSMHSVTLTTCIVTNLSIGEINQYI